MKKVLVLLIVILSLLGLVTLGWFAYQQYQIKSFTFDYFSDSLEPSEEFLELTTREPFISNVNQTTITRELGVFAFPTETKMLMERVDEMLERAKSLQAERSEAVVATHEAEYEDLLAMPVGEGTLNDYLGVETNPLIAEVFKILDHDITKHVAQEKLLHNVARPMQFDLSINSPVETPRSPSYPSLFAARSELAVEVLRNFLSEEELGVIERAVAEAQLRKEIVGVSNTFDVRYGKAFAQTFYSQVLENNLLMVEFISFVKQHESPNTTRATYDYTVALPDLAIEATSYERQDNRSNFIATIVNEGAAPVLATNTPMFTLEIDRFADGAVDEVIDIPYGVVQTGATLSVGYTNTYRWPGEHQFRFVANPYYSFPEVWHNNNFGAWTPFSI